MGADKQTRWGWVWQTRLVAKSKTAKERNQEPKKSFNESFLERTTQEPGRNLPQFTDYSPTNWQRMGDRTGVKYFRSWGGDEKQVKNPWGGGHRRGLRDRQTMKGRDTPRQEYIDPPTTSQHLTPNFPFWLSVFGKCWTNKSHPWHSQFPGLKESTGSIRFADSLWSSWKCYIFIHVKNHTNLCHCCGWVSLRIQTKSA